MNVILLSIDLLTNVLTIIDPDLPQSLYERWQLLGDLFTFFNIGEFRQDILYITDPFSEYELQFTTDAFSSLIGTTIAVQHDIKHYYWKFQLVTEENISLENANSSIPDLNHDPAKI